MTDMPQDLKDLKIGSNKQSAIDDLHCPFCSVRETNFNLLQRHVQSRHADQIESTPTNPGRGSNSTTVRSDGDHHNYSDAELAQLLAFEEAGIPSSLALEDFPRRTRSGDGDDESKAEVSVSGDSDDIWIDCFCGERVLQQEIDIHRTMHQAEMEDGDDDEELDRLSGSDSQLFARTEATQNVPGSKSTQQFKQSSQVQTQTRRLGKAELGPYANEEHMPKWLHSMLAKNVGVRREEVTIGRHSFSYPALENETPLLVPKLQLISRADPYVTYSAFCSPVVNHVRKLFQEGGFCGYRNIQMLTTYLRAQPGSVGLAFHGRLPTIFELQDAIEVAWDKGIHAVGRIETGGIKDTRKYIGTAEAQAFFTLKGIPCRAQAFKNTEGLLACDALLDSVKNYFLRKHHARGGGGGVAPIYLQYKGHSMTIVGYEELATAKGGHAHGPNLVVFDPLFRITRSLKKLSLDSSKPENKISLLKNHRYSRNHLKKYDQFELVFLES